MACDCGYHILINSNIPEALVNVKKEYWAKIE